MRTEIKELHHQLGATIVYVTHDQTEALSLADRIAVMKDGDLLQFNTPEAIYDQPQNRFVAGFLGVPRMNFLPVEHLPGWQGRSGLVAGLRPESMTIRVEKPEQPALPGRLMLSEMTGSDIILHCDSPAGRITLTSPRKDVPRHADNFWILCDLDRAVFFNSQSGSRVDLSAEDRRI